MHANLQSLIIIIIIVVVIIAILVVLTNNKPQTRSSSRTVFPKGNDRPKVLAVNPSRPNNVYLFGPSTYESGALASYYPSFVAAFTPIPGTNLRYLDTIQYNTSNRHSDGLGTIDYLSQAIGMPLVNGYSITKLPSANGNLVNYAVSGATSLGNLWNSFPSPPTFANVAGANGITDQVDMFIAHLNTSGKTINKNDLFIFASQNVNDLRVIAPLGPGAPAAIAQSINGIMTSMQQLYDLGARHILFELVGDGIQLVNAVPAFLRAEVAAPGTLVGLAGLSNFITAGFTAAISAAVDPSGSMSELDMILDVSSADASHILSNASIYGFRVSIPSDIDPRGSPSLPFPTLLDHALIVQPNRRLDRKVMFSDDFHFTQTGSKVVAEIMAKFIIPFKNVNP